MYLKALAIKAVVSPKSWTLRRCTLAVEALLRQTAFPLKLCLLIDGLNEFEGDTKATTRNLQNSSRIFLSRMPPTLRFVSQVGHGWSLETALKLLFIFSQKIYYQKILGNVFLNI
jgi:hypothetical protein